MTIIYTMLAAIGSLVLLEVLARTWVRLFEKYYVLPPGLRLKVSFDAQLFRTLR